MWNTATMARSPIRPRRRLARELQRLRAAAGQTIDQVSRATEISKSSLSRIENAQISPKIPEVRALLTYYGVSAENAERLLSDARDARQRGWWQRYPGAVPDWFVLYLGLEAEATEIDIMRSQLVPGLLQTENYARAVLTRESDDLPPEMVEQKVRLRMERQSLLYEVTAPKLSVVIDEAVLFRRVGGDDVMREQVARLIEAVHMPNVTLQIIPFDAGEYRSAGNSFSIMSFDLGEDIAYVEHCGSAIYLEVPDQVDRFKVALRSQRELALDTAASLAVLVEHIDRWMDDVPHPRGTAR